MTLRDYARILRKRWRWLAGPVLVCLVLAGLLAELQTPQFKAEARLFVSAQNDPSNPNGLFAGSQFSQERVKSYADIVASPAVTKAVIAQLGLTVSPDDLAHQISASAPPDTVLIDVDVRDPNPKRAMELANAVSQQFIQLVDQIEKPPGTTRNPVFVSVVKEADLPKAPVSPQKVLLGVLGLGAGLLLGAAAAFLRDSLDTTVKSRQDVETDLHLPVLGLIAFDKEAQKTPLLVRALRQTPRAEAFRQLRTNLQFVDSSVGLRTIVVTSSVAEEGKSTTACNLAISLAEAGRRVVLIEGDLRRPRLASYLGLEGAVGLTNVLIKTATLDDVLQPWGDNGLRVCCSGPLPPNPSELLGTNGLGDVLRQAEARADVVIIDAPPLLPVTDAAVLATKASGALLVIRAGKTKREQVRASLSALQRVDARVFGVVLNRIPTKGPDAQDVSYGSGYYTTAETATGTDAQKLTALASVREGQSRIYEPASPPHADPLTDPMPPATYPPAAARPPAAPAPEEERPTEGDSRTSTRLGWQ